MTVEFDPLVDGVLRQARAAVSPAPSELAQALAGVQRRLAQPLHELHELHDGAPQPPVPTALNAPLATSAAAIPTAALRRLFGTVLTLGIGFVIGLQYARQDSSSGGAAPLGDSLPRAAPLGDSLPRADSALLAPARAELPGTGLLPAERSLRASEPSRVEALRPVVASEARASATVSSRSRARPRPAAGVSAAPPEASARDTSPLDFSAVLERVSLAQREQRDFSPEAALRVLDELDVRADAETLREERLVTRVLAACDVGDVPAATRAARELGKSADPSVYSSRVASSCVASAAATPALSTPGSR